MTRSATGGRLPGVNVAVCEPGGSSPSDWLKCELGEDIQFSTADLESYACSRWEPVIFDAMVVAAAVEFADRSCRRSSKGWARRLAIRIPVDDPDRWKKPAVADSLLDALRFVTGDHWSVEFSQREDSSQELTGDRLSLFDPSAAVLAYSEGMDSLAVAGLAKSCLGNDVVRVRLGGRTSARNGNGDPDVSIPYWVRVGRSYESSAMSRGFTFATVSGIAAYLTHASMVIIPESGQGSLGPPLVTVGHAHPDYRNHPEFTNRMERFFRALLGAQITYEFPRLWHTKGETLARYVAIADDELWRTTKSCWKDNRWSSVGGSWHHCGVCAACMLRRVSVHAAGLAEDPEIYVCTDMSAATLQSAVHRDFKHLNGAYREYAIAGVLHMHHLAAMADPGVRGIVRRHALSLRPILRTKVDIEERVVALLEKHADEWRDYRSALKPSSFVNQWIRRN